MNTLLDFLKNPDAILLVAAELILLFSWFFETMAASSLEIDTLHINSLTQGSTDQSAIQRARATYLLYCSDMVWRVGLLSSLPFSAFGIAVLAVQAYPGMVAWIILGVIVLLLGMTYIVMVNHTPYLLQRPVAKALGALNYYQFGTLLLSGLNIVTLGFSYYRFVQRAAS